MKDTIKVFLADDHAMVREALAALIARNEDIDVVGQCGQADKISEMVRKHSPNVVVLDIAMPGLNGLEVCRQLARKSKGPAILILTMYDDEEVVATALRYGAGGYLLKEAASEQLTEAIRAVAAGDLYLGGGIPRTVLEHMHSAESDPYERLSARERQVLQMIAEGKTNREVAEQLSIAVKTVDTHRSHLMNKLDIHDQTTLVKYALRKGIVPLD